MHTQTRQLEVILETKVRPRVALAQAINHQVSVPFLTGHRVVRSILCSSKELKHLCILCVSLSAVTSRKELLLPLCKNHKYVILLLFDVVDIYMWTNRCAQVSKSEGFRRRVSNCDRQNNTRKTSSQPLRTQPQQTR